MSQKKITKLMQFDPLHEAEQITGKRYSSSEETSYLGMWLQMQKNEELERLLKESNDTTFSMAMKDYLAIVTNFGFKVVFMQEFKTKWKHETDVHYVLFHEDLGLILNCDSFDTRVNSATLYYNWAPHPNIYRYSYTSSGGYWWPTRDQIGWLNPDGTTHAIPNYPTDFKYSEFDSWEEYLAAQKKVDEEKLKLQKQAEAEGKRNVWSGYHDARTGLLNIIKNLTDNGVLLKTWVDCPFHWLTNYMEHNQDYSYPYTQYEDSTEIVLSHFPQEAKNCINNTYELRKNDRSLR